MPNRKPYPTDVSDDGWAFVAPYLTLLLPPGSAQRVRDLREVFDALRWTVRTGSPWRYLPHGFPPWEAVYQQTRRRPKAGAFERMVHGLREPLRLARGRPQEPPAAALGSRTLRSIDPGERPPRRLRRGQSFAGKKGSKVHAAVRGHFGAPLRAPLAWRCG